MQTENALNLNNSGMFGLVIRADNTILLATPDDGQHFTLEEAKAIVGGYIQVLRWGGGARDSILIINEDGCAESGEALPYNNIASAMAQEAVLGDVLLCPTGALQ